MSRIFPSITPSWDRDDDDDPGDLEADSVEPSDIYDEDSDDKNPEDDDEQSREEARK